MNQVLVGSADRFCEFEFWIVSLNFGSIVMLCVSQATNRAGSQRGHVGDTNRHPRWLILHGICRGHSPRDWWSSITTGGRDTFVVELFTCPWRRAPFVRSDELLIHEEHVAKALLKLFATFDVSRRASQAFGSEDIWIFFRTRLDRVPL